MSWWRPTTNAALSKQIAALQTTLTAVLKQGEKIMAGIVEINSAETTLHGDLVARNGLIKQLLTAFANQTLTPAQAQAIVDGMNADDADAKNNIVAIQALNPPAAEPATPATPAQS